MTVMTVEVDLRFHMFKDSSGNQWLKDDDQSLSRLPSVQMTSATRPAGGVLGSFGGHVSCVSQLQVVGLRQWWLFVRTLKWLCSP